MFHLQYFSSDDWGQTSKQDFHYRSLLGNRIEYAGQARDQRRGRSRLRHYGSESEARWRERREQGFRVNPYHVPINDEALGAMVQDIEKWMPEH
ncbi:uncharacterized protein N7515_000514 [Penicillium bovifimosum]|uniref:Uncharacterized protein n=1 Tax=Penicillium bovifimosum TaxID=126998 RepID=A0A9W9HHH5_9EURO|nr:uncharacterized protein N7515_000514 [Penicillium bovifimosum]KAJ5145950.1 hypothetical protein N7515_000514 [Penicillium bovifimosum]